MSDTRERIVIAAKLLFINGGYHTLQYTLYGTVLGLWH